MLINVKGSCAVPVAFSSQPKRQGVTRTRTGHVSGIRVTSYSRFKRVTAKSEGISLDAAFHLLLIVSCAVARGTRYDARTGVLAEHL